MTFDARRVHMMDGFCRSGRRFRAVCTCGEATTPRASEALALAALHSEHGTTRPMCVLCEHDYSGRAWEQLRRDLWILKDGVNGEFLACRDAPRECTDTATARQVHLNRTAFEAFGLAPPRPALRVIPGGKA